MEASAKPSTAALIRRYRRIADGALWGGALLTVAFVIGAIATAPQTPPGQLFGSSLWIAVLMLSPGTLLYFRARRLQSIAQNREWRPGRFRTEIAALWPGKRRFVAPAVYRDPVIELTGTDGALIGVFKAWGLNATVRFAGRDSGEIWMISLPDDRVLLNLPGTHVILRGRGPRSDRQRRRWMRSFLRWPELPT